MKLKLLKLGNLFLFLFLIHTLSLFSQCYITTDGNLCVNSPISFQCNTVGYSSINWDFNSEGSNQTNCNPVFTFSTPGVKLVKLRVTLNNQTCNTQVYITIHSAPVIKIRLNSPKTQCFKGNSYCFIDSSTVDNDSICKRVYQFDDGTNLTFQGNKRISFCKSFKDPVGGTYGFTVVAFSCNGCVSSRRYSNIAVIQPALNLTFTSSQPKSCDSFYLVAVNNSLVFLDSLFSFEWDWGDGTKTIGDKNTPSKWKVQVLHKYKAGGNINGTFDVKLSAIAMNGCKDTFVFKDAGTIINPNATIISNYDSVCISNSEITFSIKEGQVPLANNPLYIFEVPPIPNNISRSWSAKHKFSKPGPHLIKLSYTSSLPGCARTVTDTIIVIGPQAAIELGIPNNIKSAERYQCMVKDTIHFTNFTRYYHNDKNVRDDDSVLLFNSGFNRPLIHQFNFSSQTSVNPKSLNRLGNNVSHFWDFGDEYCEKCTSDIANNININSNCRYSRDQYPVHLYTDWETVYERFYSSKPQYYSRYLADSNMAYFSRVWADDSMAIVRDTIVYYGDNFWGNSAKDSALFSILTKHKTRYPYIYGVSEDLMSRNTRFYLKSGDTAYIDSNNGMPPSMFTGPRYLMVLSGQTINLRRKTDTAYYVYSLEIIQDTIAISRSNGRKIWKKIKTPGYVSGDSINPNLHRQKFYESSAVHCFKVSLSEKDLKHPLACSSEQSISLSLMSASAKNLRKKGYQCLSNYGFDDRGITFILDETKPGCTMTWAEFNFNYDKYPNDWKLAVGKNLSSGSIPMGNYPPSNPPYLNFSGYGAPDNKYSTQYDTGFLIPGKNTVDVGLIIGNGIFPNGIYPDECQDTVIYRDFIRFQIMDASFDINSGNDKTDFFQFCKNDPILVSPSAANKTDVDDVGTITYRITNSNAGKNHRQVFQNYVIEKYKRFNIIHKDSNFLVDSLIIEKHRVFGTDKLVSRTAFPIAKIKSWHTIADIGNVYEIFKSQLQSYGLNILDFNETQLAGLIWNGKGKPGKAYTGAKGIVDTTGFGHLIYFKTIADNKTTLHFRDTSLKPLETHTGNGGKTYSSYLLKPELAGYYLVEMLMEANNVTHCTERSSRSALVGFYMDMNYDDTVICPGQMVLTRPEFRYFNPYPDLVATNCNDSFPYLLDCKDYWRDRIGETGMPNREGFTITDLNKDDDNINIPKTIFGGYPYSLSGLDNFGQNPAKLKLNSSLYYLSDSARSYVIRTATADSNGCRDTFTQRIHVVVPKADFSFDTTLNTCSFDISLKDKSYFKDPLKPLTGKNSDELRSLTILWGVKGIYNKSTYLYPFPADLTHHYSKNGTYRIGYSITTKNGCVATDSVTIHKNGPVPFFDTTFNKNICIGTDLKLKNLSSYLVSDTCLWTWEFGDGVYDNQYLRINSSNDTIHHKYTSAGVYELHLHVNNQVIINNKRTYCHYVFPDINEGDEAISIRVRKCDSTDIDQAPDIVRIRMFPNPANNSVSFDTEEEQVIQIINNLGQIVATIRVNGKETFDFSYLNSGLYIVKTLDQKYIGKLIVNHDN